MNPISTRIHQLDVAHAIAALHSTSQGLSSAQALQRLREHGRNVIEAAPSTPIALRLLKEFTHFFSIVLWIAAAIALLMEHLTPGEGMARLALVIIAVIVVSGLFAFWQEFRAEREFAALCNLLPHHVDVYRDGTVAQVPLEMIVPGDVVLLDAGARVPADCRLIEAFGVRVNNAAVTGESASVARDLNPSGEATALEAKNVLLAGTDVVAGRATAIVFATGMDTEFGGIAKLSQSVVSQPSPLRNQLARLSRRIIAMAVVIALVFFSLGWIIGVPLWEDFMLAIGIIIAMVPEGLLPTLTLALVLATHRLAKRKVLIRHLPAVETLGSTTVICTDKTGTLTLNRMTVREILLGASEHIVLSDHLKLTDRQVTQYRALFSCAMLCHDLINSGKSSKSTWRGDPMEVALAEMAAAVLGETPSARKINEIPLDSDRMRLSTVYESGNDQQIIYCKGALESVLPLCTRAQGNGRDYPMTPQLQKGIVDAHAAMAQRGLRVLAFAFRGPEPMSTHDIESNLVFAGLAGLEDPPRPEVPEAIQKCREAGIKVIMVTGDHPQTAVALAREIGLVRTDMPTVVSGHEMRRLSHVQLFSKLDDPEIVFARVAPDQKRQIVDALKRKQHIVAVTGDGVNDAPALKSAHIGIAMGISGTDVAKAAADVVLLDDNFASIVRGVEEGRTAFDNIRKFLTYILAHNVPELIPNLVLALAHLPLALTPLQILAVDMGTDSLTALGLGTERSEPDTMRRPPRPASEPLLDRSTALRAYLLLGVIEAVAALSAFWFVLRASGWQPGNPLPISDPGYVQATTACLCAIVVMQFANVFLCRSASRSVLAIGPFGNRLILWGVLFEVIIIALVVYSPLGHMVFDTAPLPFDAWLVALPFVFLLVLGDEAYKRLRERAAARHQRICRET